MAAAIVACRHAGVELGSATVGQLGLGAAGYGIAALMVDGGVGRVIAFDPQEASHARALEKGIEMASMADVMGTADVVVATTGRLGLMDPSLVRSGQVFLAASNLDAEIASDADQESGA